MDKIKTILAALSGKVADIYAPAAPMSPTQRAELESLIFDADAAAQEIADALEIATANAVKPPSPIFAPEPKADWIAPTRFSA